VNTIAIVDYGMGNLHSVARALRAAAPDANILIAREAHDIDQATRIVLPGQGAMPDCMRTLAASGLRQAVLHAAVNKPMLGICVGEQMLFSHSDEGKVAGLDVFAGHVTRFADTRLKIPHMGWNCVHQKREHPLWRGIADQTFFYFAHSYYAIPDSSDLTVGQSDYGVKFTCAVARDNIFAVQFHPEKSAQAGLQLYRNFAHWNP